MSTEETILRWVLHFIGVMIIWYLAITKYGKHSFKNWLKTLALITIAVVLLGLKLND